MNVKVVPMGRWVVWPTVITLVVTLARLAGELNEWSPLFFSRAVGGGAALVGIVWLVPLFGIYFAWKLISAGRRGSPGRTLGIGAVGLVILLAGGLSADVLLRDNVVASFVIFGVVAIIAIVVTRWGWPDLFALLLSYGFAVRIPMVVIYFLAFWLGWSTHYSAVPPDFPLTGWLTDWLALGLVPQLTFWVAFTVVIGSIFGGFTLLVRGKGARRAGTGQ